LFPSLKGGKVLSAVLITGFLGFAGRWLVDCLAGTGLELVGAYFEPQAPALGDPIRQVVRLVSLDICNQDQCVSVLRDVRPDFIYHLAAIVPIHLAFSNPSHTLEVNVLGTANLLEAVRKTGLSPRILLPGSSEEYGLIHPGEVPVAETQPLRPTNPYGISKVAATLLGIQYFRNYGTQVVACRPFNMTGPGQASDYACPAFARQIAMIELGLAEPVIRVGSLASKRDFSDVRDIMRACAALLEKGTPGEIYNMCSGLGVSIQEVLDRLLAMSAVKIKVEVDPARLRASENPLIVGDNRKLVSAIGYKPGYNLDQTLRDVLDYWRARAKADKLALPGQPGQSV
jgi:GDP-4-dehydro-6-deoxy-D-mannose reductase